MYTNRRMEAVKIKHVTGAAVTWTNGWSFGGVPEEHHDKLKVGAEFLLETVNFSKVTGMATLFYDTAGEAVVDQWLFHKTDEDLDREHEQMIENFKRADQERLDANREEWTLREARLPNALRMRLQRFRDAGGEDFDRGGWGYELTVCELAVMYANNGQQDTDNVWRYAEQHGTSGNQHEYAKALSRLLQRGDHQAVATSVSALSPITGSPDYSTKD